MPPGFEELFSNPVIGFIGTVATLLFGLLSVYLYAQSRERPGLTACVSPARAVVVKSGQTSQLKVTYKGEELTTDVSAAQIVVWNRGRAPIRQSDVLRPLCIRTQDGSPIVDGVVRKRSRDVTNLELNAVDAESGLLRVSWDILERNDGAIIQIIYAGATTTDILFDAVIVGQGGIMTLLRKPSRAHRIIMLFLILLALGALFCIGSLGAIAGMVSVAASITAMVVQGAEERTPQPPFGFQT